MQRKTWVISVVVIAAIALVGLMIALMPHKAKETETAQPAEKPGAAQPGSPAQLAGKTPDFAFRRLEIDTAKAQGEACLVFTGAVDDSGGTRYADYVTLEPGVPVEIRPQGNRLCLAGLSFGTDYHATLRAGLPGAKGTKLAAAETVPVSLRDRPPFVGFGEGFILPRSGTDGVPVTTVNVKTVELQVIRVNDRLLSQLRSDLISERTIYGYDRQQMAGEQGREVWRGTMEVTGATNESAITLFPLRQAIKSESPGVYLLTARDTAKKAGVDGNPDDDDWQGRASQWVIDTDIGLTTYAGADGLHVFARSLSGAEPQEGIELVLVARDNGELARAKTDRDGEAKFASGLMRGAGGAEPVLVTAYGKAQDFAYADLRRPAFDLSDRGVSGRDAPGPVDAYLFTERGIYRPGEIVELVTLLRDREARAQADLPVTLIMRRPDGLEYRKLQAGALKAGGAHVAIPLTPTAPRGRWSVSAYLGTDEKALGRVSFDVQDFVPERLKVTLDAPKTALRPGDEIKIGVNARFLYGAPAANLGGSAELRITRADDPFPNFAGYRFGLAEENFAPAGGDLTLDRTDATGEGAVTGTLDAALASSAPLKAQVTVSLDEPGGRATREQVETPVLTGDVYLGLRPNFDSDQVAENSDAHFELIALDRAGTQIARDNLRYEVIREETDYQWYQAEDGQWRFDTVTRDKLIETGTIKAEARAAVPLKARVEWGAYRVSVRDSAGQAASSVRFYAGWGAAGTENRPDRLNVASKAPSYIVGEKAVITLRPPVPGKALVVLAADKVLDSKLIDVPQGGTEVSFDVTNEWGPGVYALVTLYRPVDGKGGGKKMPARAIGLTWLGVDMKDRTLALDIGAPAVVRPRTKIEIPVTVTNARPGEAVEITLAAVDEGILQLTDYESPAPSGYYFGKRRLGVEIRDDYGRLIQADGSVGPIRSGGDSLGGRGLTAVPTRTVALFSGLLEADGKGRVIVPLDIPDFVGELRLMATAFGPARLGEAAKPLTVRDPVVADLTLPRFLAPGDESTATLLLDNVEGAAGPYKATLGATGAVSRGDAKPIETTLAQKQQQVIRLPIKAGEPGLSSVTLALEGPNGLTIKRSWPIEVRPAALPDFKQSVEILNPNAETRLAPDLLQGFLPQTASLSLAVAERKGFDVPGLLKWLDRYPFGCIEQTTSRALPLLYANKLAVAAGLAADKPVEARVQEAIERVVDMQMIDGGFGMWSARGEAADPWIGVFAADFLTEAKAKNFVVPDAALKQTYNWLRGIAGSDGTPDGTRAYALYVLARAAAVPVGDVRYFFDTQRANFKTLVGPAFAGAALAELGDKARAADGFTKARALAATADRASYAPQAYGSLLRDLAAVTALAAGAGETAALPQLMTRTAEIEPPLELTTTQEKAWLIRAASALDDASAGFSVEVKGTAATSTKSTLAATPGAAELAQGVSLLNKGQAPVWYTATATGIPLKPPPAQADGLTIEKRYLTLDGAPADLAHVKQSTRLIVSIQGRAQENVFRNAAVLDLLPAGFEIEAVLEPLADGSSPYSFLENLTPLSIGEARDDRFVAAFGLGDRYPDKKRLGLKPPYHVAYVVRAVTPGRYVLPGAQAEDMYRPEIRARTAAETLAVEAGE